MKAPKIVMLTKMFISTLVLGTIQTVLGAFVFMLLVGVVRTELYPGLHPVGYFASLLIIGLSQILFTLLRIGIDYRDAFR